MIKYQQILYHTKLIFNQEFNRLIKFFDMRINVLQKVDKLSMD
jgi:hypothetical protein